MATAPSLAQIMVGGAPMDPSKNIAENAVDSKDGTTLVARQGRGGGSMPLN
jgi:hypothetical protein